MVTPAAKRNAGAYLMHSHQMSEGRACKASGLCRMTVRYETRRSGDDSLRARMKALAHERCRFGYRRIHVLLRREGHRVKHKKLFRPYREGKLTVRKRGGRKRAICTRAPMLVPMVANDRWSLDFVSDQLTDGRTFRVLTIVDDCTRECLGLVADTSLSGLRVRRMSTDASTSLTNWIIALIRTSVEPNPLWDSMTQRCCNRLVALLANNLRGLLTSQRRSVIEGRQQSGATGYSPILPAWDYRLLAKRRRRSRRLIVSRTDGRQLRRIAVLLKFRDESPADLAIPPSEEGNRQVNRLSVSGAGARRTTQGLRRRALAVSPHSLL